MKHFKLCAVVSITLTVLGMTLAAITPALQAQSLARPVAAISLSLPYTQDFNTLATSGTSNAWTDDATVNGWHSTRTTYAAGSGSDTLGSLYSYGSSGSAERALGALSSNTTGDIYYGVKLINDTAQTINVITVTYTGEQWRNGGNATAQLTTFAYQVDATALTTGPWTDVPALDFASPIHTSTAGALDGNAAANRATLSAVINLVVAPGQTVLLRWFDVNDSGSDHGLAIDDFSVTANVDAGDVPPIVVSTSPANNTANVLTTTNVLINFSEPVTVTGSWYAIICTVSGLHTAAVSGGPINFTLDPAADFDADESCTATVFAAQVTDQDDPIDLMTSNYVWSFATTPGTTCPTPINTLRAIGEVQGSDAASPFNGQKVTVRGTVTGKYALTGFFVQSSDGITTTADGIFVNSTTSVNIGDAVQVNGTIGEANTLTQLTSAAVAVCGTPSPIAPTIVTLPVPAGTTLELYEDMLVTFSQTLTADQNFFQGRYGQVTLSSNGRMFNPTNGNGLGDTPDLNLRRMIILDDSSSAQNPNPIPYIGADNTLRAGDTTTNLTGVIDYGPINSNSAIRHYRLQPTGAVAFTRVNTRTSTPPNVGGSLKVASFNVLNYFNGNGSGGGFPTSRGADTLAEFNRQRTKIITAMVALNADVVGLMEIENDGAGSLSAIQDLVTGLNAATAPNTYALVAEPAPGTDEIKVAMIYQPGRVTPIGSAQNYQINTTDYIPLFDRPPLIQRFQEPSGQQFYVVVNHFKSKGSCPSSGVDTDQGDGQGCWNVKRTAQANELINFIETLQPLDPDVIVIGDLNAYGAEDPIVVLQDGDLIDQVAARVPAADRYSYVFDGQAGYLDHALTTASLNASITGVRHWHINADEPSVIDYNTEFKPQDFYTPTPYRASDHDPVLIGLSFAPDFSGSSKNVNTTSLMAGELLTYTLIVSNSGNFSGTFALTDTLIAPLSLISAPGLTLSGATLTGSGLVESHTLQTFSITVRVDAGYVSVVTNTAQLSGDGAVRNLTAPVVTVQSPPAPDFSASSKLVNTTVVTGSQLFTYTLFIANSGETSGTFALTDTLDARLTVVNAAGLNVNGATLTVTGTLNALISQSFEVVVRAAPGFSGTITNTATLSGDGQIRSLIAPSVTHKPATVMYVVYLPVVQR